MPDKIQIQITECQDKTWDAQMNFPDYSIRIVQADNLPLLMSKCGHSIRKWKERKNVFGDTT